MSGLTTQELRDFSYLLKKALHDTNIGDHTGLRPYDAVDPSTQNPRKKLAGNERRWHVDGLQGPAVAREGIPQAIERDALWTPRQAVLVLRDQAKVFNGRMPYDQLYPSRQVVRITAGGDRCRAHREGFQVEQTAAALGEAARALLRGA